MAVFGFRAKTGQDMALDVCIACQSIWFDKHESQQLGATETLDLFRMIHATGPSQGRPWSAKLKCPRCAVDLAPTTDLCKSGRFSYFHCVHQHGRFTAFSAFLIEKGFVRQLSGEERKTLAARIGTVTCSGCGAAVDITKDSVCNFCHSPVVVLDPNALEDAIQALEKSAIRQHALDKVAVVDALLLSERQKWLDDLHRASTTRKGHGATRTTGRLLTAWICYGICFIGRGHMLQFTRLCKVACCLGLACLLASCATMSPEECQQAQWHDVGQRDGLRGAPLSVLNARVEDCAKVDMVVDTQAYHQGRDLGLANYCRVENAVPLGLSGAGYAGVCPPAIEMVFVPRYQVARAVFVARSDIKNLYDRTEYLERRMREINRNEDERLRSTSSDAERNKIRREADDDRRNTRNELLETDRRLHRKRDELRAAEFDLGNLR